MLNLAVAAMMRGINPRLIVPASLYQEIKDKLGKGYFNADGAVIPFAEPPKKPEDILGTAEDWAQKQQQMQQMQAMQAQQENAKHRVTQRPTKQK